MLIAARKRETALAATPCFDVFAMLERDSAFPLIRAAALMDAMLLYYGRSRFQNTSRAQAPKCILGYSIKFLE